MILEWLEGLDVKWFLEQPLFNTRASVFAGLDERSWNSWFATSIRSSVVRAHVKYFPVKF
jgi:hypothetical protein